MHEGVSPQGKGGEKGDYFSSLKPSITSLLLLLYTKQMKDCQISCQVSRRDIITEYESGRGRSITESCKGHLSRLSTSSILELSLSHNEGGTNHGFPSLYFSFFGGGQTRWRTRSPIANETDPVPPFDTRNREPLSSFPRLARVSSGNGGKQQQTWFFSRQLMGKKMQEMGYLHGNLELRR